MLPQVKRCQECGEPVLGVVSVTFKNVPMYIEDGKERTGEPRYGEIAWMETTNTYCSANQSHEHEEPL